jgi:hypothetical protein
MKSGNAFDEKLSEWRAAMIRKADSAQLPGCLLDRPVKPGDDSELCVPI